MLFIILLVVGFDVSEAAPPKLLVLAFDGLRYDYINLTGTPTLHSLIQKGLFVPEVQPVFPASKQPNLYSIATGWYPGQHGMLSNFMYDPLTSHVLDENSAETYDYNPYAIPIWVLNQQELNHFSATIMWPGGSVSINNAKPVYSLAHNIDMNWQERMERAIKYIKDEKYPANLVMMAFESPADAVLFYGPNNYRIKDSMKKVDNAVSHLLNSLEKNHIIDEINIIITTDAGYYEVTHDRIIDLGKVIDMNDVEVYGRSPVFNIVPKPDKDIPIYEQLKEASKKYNFSAYHRLECPAKWKLDENRRLGTIIVVADPSYAFQDINVKPNVTIGLSGYDNYYRGTHGLFIGYGPSFIPGKIGTLLSSVDIYPLMCQLLDIKPPPSNGSFEEFHPYISSMSFISVIPRYRGALLIACVLVVGLNALFFVIYKFIKSENKYASNEGFLFRLYIVTLFAYACPS